jgi:hypothetical protein
MKPGTFANAHPLLPQQDASNPAMPMTPNTSFPRQDILSSSIRT